MSDAAPPAAAAPPVETPPPPSRKKIRLALGMGLVSVLIVSGGAWIAYQKLKAPNQPPPRVVPRVSEKKAAPSTSQSTPLPTVARKETAPAPASVTTAPARGPAASTAAEPVARAVDATVNPERNPAAQDWINKLKISGVRGGASPKILLQGKTFEVGDVIHADFGLAFAGYDPARDTVRFKDRNGATYERGVR